MLPESKRPELILSYVLRGGILLSLFMTILGGLKFILQHGEETLDYHTFHGEPYYLSNVLTIFDGAFSWHSHTIIQFGILLLIMTPLIRVLSCLLIFLWQRDRLYIFLASFVFAILIYSLFWENR